MKIRTVRVALDSTDADTIVAGALKILEARASYGSALTSPTAVRDYLRIAIGQREHEVFVCVWLDAQHRVLAFDELFRGTLTQTSVYPREIVKAALARNAAAVIFAQSRISRHNALH